MIKEIARSEDLGNRQYTRIQSMSVSTGRCDYINGRCTILVLKEGYSVIRKERDTARSRTDAERYNNIFGTYAYTTSLKYNRYEVPGHWPGYILLWPCGWLCGGYHLRGLGQRSPLHRKHAHAPVLWWHGIRQRAHITRAHAHPPPVCMRVYRDRRGSAAVRRLPVARLCAE
jgi:hypothetical protein